MLIVVELVDAIKKKKETLNLKLVLDILIFYYEC